MKTFKHNKISLPVLETEEINNRRYYVTPKGDKYPSITTLLSQGSKESLEAWKRSIGEVEAKKISDYACELGTNFHRLIEKYIDNDQKFLEGALVQSKYMFNGIEKHLDNIDNVLTQEATLFSDVLGIAGRTDCIGEYKGKLSIIDFKSSRKEKRKEDITNYFVQGTGYSLMLEEMTGIKIQNIVIVMSTYDCIPLEFIEQRKDYFCELRNNLKEHLPKIRL